VSSTQSSVIQIIYRDIGLKCFIHLPKFVLLSLIFLTIILHKVV